MVQLKPTEAHKYRKMIEKAADSLTDEEALSVPMLFERWGIDKHYPVGKRLFYNDKIYSVLIEHDSIESWAPDVAVSLFAEVLIPDPTVIPDWVQPGSTNPYMKGDKVRHNGKIWISDYDNNVWEPGIFGWTETT